MSQVILVLDTRELSTRLLPILRSLAAVWKIMPEDIESLYDWIIAEGLQRVLNVMIRGHLSNHYRHDVYLCVFGEIYREGTANIEAMIKHLLQVNNVEFLQNQRIKIMVTYDTLIIVKSNDHKRYRYL